MVKEATLMFQTNFWKKTDFSSFDIQAILCDWKINLMWPVFFPGPGVNQNIIDIHTGIVIQVLPQELINKPLEDHRAIY